MWVLPLLRASSVTAAASEASIRLGSSSSLFVAARRAQQRLGPGTFKGQIEALWGGPKTLPGNQMRLLLGALSIFLPPHGSSGLLSLLLASPALVQATLTPWPPRPPPCLPGTDFLADPSTTSAAATVKPTQKRPCSSCTSARPALSCAVDRRPTIRPCQGTPTIGQRGPRRPASQCRDEDDRRGRTKMHQNVSILLTGLSPPPRPASPR